MANNVPLVSVIMTSFNHEKYLCEAIESVLRQTLEDYELIIIDDASQDNSKETIESYALKDSRIKANFHSVNKGIAKTWNEGVRYAKGKYIAIAASDDIWFHNKLQKQIEVLNQNEYLIVWTQASMIDSRGNNTGRLFTQYYKAENKKKNGYLLEDLLWGNFICPQSLMLKKEIAQEFGFDKRIKYAVDYKFLVSVSQKYMFHFISEPLVKYRMHGVNTIFQDRKT